MKQIATIKQRTVASDIVRRFRKRGVGYWWIAKKSGVFNLYMRGIDTMRFNGVNYYVPDWAIFRLINWAKQNNYYKGSTKGMPDEKVSGEDSRKAYEIYISHAHHWRKTVSSDKLGKNKIV